MNKKILIGVIIMSILVGVHDEKIDSPYDVYGEVVAKYECKDASLMWRILDSILPASVVLKLRGNRGNCAELSRYIVENSADCHLIYLDKNYNITYDYRGAVHCAVETSRGFILDVTYARGNAYRGMFLTKPKWRRSVMKEVSYDVNDIL